MPNARDAELEAHKRVLLVGRSGAGKTTQIWTLPGKKFLYIFDPNALSSLQGCDVDYESFSPDVLELDMSLKGFNKGAKSDKPTNRSKSEPSVFLKWVDDFNKRYDAGFFNDYQWLLFDSATFFTKALMDRQLFINGRYGEVEDRADYKIVGAKISDIFSNISQMKINIMMTGHIATFQDEKTQRIDTQISLPGRARNSIPMQFTDIWMTYYDGEGQKGEKQYRVRTVPDARGLQDIRCSIQGLQPVEDVTIRDFKNPTLYGVGKLLQQGKAR